MQSYTLALTTTVFLACSLLIGCSTFGGGSAEVQGPSTAGQHFVYKQGYAKTSPASAAAAGDWGVEQKPFHLLLAMTFEDQTASSPDALVVAGFEGVSAPAIEVLVSIRSGPLCDEIRAFDGDHDSDVFGLKRLADDALKAMLDSCPELEVLSLALVDASAARTSSPFTHLQLHRSNHWEVEEGRFLVSADFQKKNVLASYAPAPGQEGILPSHWKFPNLHSGQGPWVQLPNRDWTLFYRSGRVTYDYARDPSDISRVVLVASPEKCPGGPQVYDLYLNVEQFGGQEAALKQVEFEMDDYCATGLSRVFTGYLERNTSCAEARAGLTPEATLRVWDQSDRAAPLGTLLYRYHERPLKVVGLDGVTRERQVLSVNHPQHELDRAAAGKAALAKQEIHDRTEASITERALQAKAQGKSSPDVPLAYLDLRSYPSKEMMEFIYYGDSEFIGIRQNMAGYRGDATDEFFASMEYMTAMRVATDVYHTQYWKRYGSTEAKMVASGDEWHGIFMVTSTLVDGYGNVVRQGSVSPEPYVYVRAPYVKAFEETQDQAKAGFGMLAQLAIGLAQTDNPSGGLTSEVALKSFSSHSKLRKSFRKFFREYEDDYPGTIRHFEQNLLRAQRGETLVKIAQLKQED